MINANPCHRVVPSPGVAVTEAATVAGAASLFFTALNDGNRILDGRGNVRKTSVRGVTAAALALQARYEFT
jgi:hypothetical protein